ncbi:uncharacterized protein LOC123531346 [Mercenaria mercenaria]|uniref:uncharacterized protein LOC123531346 n=1 Tax=Mercenaria mercenaria TaxID=6596 RepID=UPI001E1DB448|nr:uncharacterized protein LOC123531346 [Mercenaria mercenaria]
MESAPLIFLLLWTYIACPVVPMPLHASCKAEWNFSADCMAIENRLVTIINQWGGPDNCKNGGERCLYKLKTKTDTEITATHETPKKHYVDDLTFTFIKTSDNACTVKGFSTSETWYALLDQGTNYCNLHNLITGADLDKLPGYKETTSNSVCTQYTKADCDKY